MISVEFASWADLLILFPMGFMLYYLIKSLFKKSKADLKRAGVSFVGVIAIFVIYLIVTPMSDIIDQADAVKAKPVAVNDTPAINGETTEEEEVELSLLTPDILIAILETQALADYGDFAYDEKLDVVTFTPDMDDDMYTILLVAASGDTTDYEQLKLWFEGLSESVWDALEVPFGVLNPEDTDKPLLWYENGKEIFDFLGSYNIPSYKGE